MEDLYSFGYYIVHGGNYIYGRMKMHEAAHIMDGLDLMLCSLMPSTKIKRDLVNTETCVTFKVLRPLQATAIEVAPPSCHFRRGGTPFESLSTRQHSL
ncbi:hypothetical protein ACLOJK_020584 [Asimina triloba]